MYHHFASKEDLFQSAYEEVERELCDAVARAASRSGDPVEQLRLGALSFLDAAATDEVRRIVLLDAPAVLAVETRRALAERYGLGLVRGALLAAEQADRLAVGPVDALAPIVLAALHEAATSIADGADEVAVRAAVEGILEAITVASPSGPPPAARRSSPDDAGDGEGP
jgi:AcrR family transcriptional regulator